MTPPYTFTFYQPADFQWTDRDGTVHQETGRAGDRRVVNDACDALSFLNAAVDSGLAARGDARTRAAIDEASAACGATPGGTTVVTAPLTPPPLVDPSATGPDTPPPGGQETSERLAAPETGPDPLPRVEAEAQERPPGTADDRPLPQQFYDPLNPLPLADLPSIVLQQVPLDAADDTITSILHNDPPPGQPHHDFGLDDNQSPDTFADPVILFSGAYAVTVTDVQIPSRGFPLALTRTYRSGAVRFGPWGYNWDHSYNVYLRELDDGGAAVWTGTLGEDVYSLNPDGTFEPPLGIHRLLERRAGTPLQPDRWVLTDGDGMQQVFERPAGWPHPGRLPLVSLEDRHGNAHSLDYDAEGHLERVSDHAGRFIEFVYGDCDLLEEVHDHAGRRWLYLHDAAVEHLETVVSPVTPEYPDGLATRYEYDRGQDHPALRHNITRVLDPAGREVVRNEYGIDPGSDDFGRVVRQEYGGFEAQYAATGIQYVPRVPDAINVPARRVEVLEGGVLQVHTFNYRGDLLDHRYRLVRDGSFRLVARVNRYDEQGNCIERREPNGLGFITEFDSANSDPRGRGNPLRISLTAPPSRPAPGREIARYAYEPRYHRLKKARDERGAETSYIYDYEVSAVDSGDMVRIEHPDVTLPDGTVQSASEEFTYNAEGQIAERRSGEGHRFTYEYYSGGAADGYLRRTTAGTGAEDQTQEFGYDAFGNLSQVTTARGSVTAFERNALGQLVRLRKPAVAGMTGDVVYGYGDDGRVHTVDTPRGDYDDGSIADPFLRHEYEYDVLGHIRAAVYGANTAEPRRWVFERTSTGQPLRVTDPLGRVTRTDYDERMLPLRQTLFPRTLDERRSTLVYDRNGKMIRFNDAAGRRVDHEYDSWDRLRSIELPGATGARTEVRYTYGDRDLIERCLTRGIPRPGSALATLEDWSQTFDDRGLIATRSQGAVTEECWHDRDGRPVRIVDQRGAATEFVRDALGRPTRLTDAAGNWREHTYDEDGDLVGIADTELDPGGAATSFATELEYDARGRLRLVSDPLGNATAAEYDDRDLPVETTSPRGLRTEFSHDLEGRVTASRLAAGGLIAEHRWQRDAGGRVLSYTDPEGSTTAYEYDLEDRWRAIVTPDGRRRERAFDAAGQLAREKAPSGAQSRFSYGPDGAVERIEWTAPAGILAVSDLLYARDGLGRPVAVAQGTDLVELGYDELGRLESETRGGETVAWSVDDAAGAADLSYPNGRVDRYVLDSLGRVSSIELQAIGAPPSTGAGLTTGAMLAAYEYVGQRLASRTLANGCVSEYRYDPGRRLTAIDHLDGAGNPIVRSDYVHDADGSRRFVAGDPAPGATALVEADGLGRLTGQIEGFAAPAPPADPDQADADAFLAGLGTPTGAVEHEFAVDLADVRTRKTVNESGTAITDDYTTDPAQRITQLTRTDTAGPSTFPFGFDDSGRCVRDHRHRYVYDAMGRLREVTDISGASLLTQDYDPAGRVSERSAGGSTQSLRYLGFRAVEAESGATVMQRCIGAHPDELVLESAGQDRWAHQDARLSLLAVTDGAGVPLERYSYSPFGSPTIWAPDGVTPRGASSVGVAPIFGGHRETGIPALYDARARVYDAETGRFLQRDPRGYASSPNPYIYVAHDPVDLVDPSGEIAPIIAAIVIIGALAGAGYSFYDAYHHPERYEGPFAFRAFFNTAAGAVIGGASALGGEAVLASVGMGSFGAGAAGGTALAGSATTLSVTQTFVLSGTVSTVSGLIWRTGFNGLFPEYIEPPSVDTMATDYVLGGAIGVGFRALEAVGNPFSRAGWNTIRTSLAEASVRARMWAHRLTFNPARADQLGRSIAEIRVARLHAGELQAIGQELEPFAVRIPGEGQRFIPRGEVDVVVDSAWIQVKASAVPGRAARFDLAQAEYTAWGSPTGQSIFYVEPGRGMSGVVRDLYRAGVTQVRPLTPALRGTEPFPLPFRGVLGMPMAQVPWAALFPDDVPSGGNLEPVK